MREKTVVERLAGYEEFARPTNPVCADLQRDARREIEKLRECLYIEHRTVMKLIEAIAEKENIIAEMYEDKEKE